MSCGIAIFVKTPSLSPVKTRLWPGIGQRRAEALYLASAEAVASVAKRAREGIEVQAYWAVAEEAALDAPAWADLDHLSQGSGCLGQRMAHVYRQLRQRHHAAILIGADAPQLQPAMLARAADWLAVTTSRLVLGRAEDGGFWLFGGNTQLAGAAWTGPRYSAPDTAQQFACAMRDQGRWLELETLRDIDHASDIEAVQAQLFALSAPTPEQTRLALWLRELANERSPA